MEPKLVLVPSAFLAAVICRCAVTGLRHSVSASWVMVISLLARAESTRKGLGVMMITRSFSGSKKCDRNFVILT